MLPGTAITADAPQSLEEQRRNFREGQLAWARGSTEKFHRIMEELTAYPLHPYLLYLHSSRRQATYPEARDFILSYPDFPDNHKLLGRWLPYLAAQQRWDEFLEIYDPRTKSEKLRCLTLTPGATAGRSQEAWMEAAVELFLSGKSRHPACDPAFARIYASPQADTLVPARIELALEHRQVGLARYLLRQLRPALQPGAERLLQAHQVPLRVLRTADAPDTALERLSRYYAVRRLAARGRLDEAVMQWRTLQLQYTDRSEESERTARYLARKSLPNKHPAVLELLDQAGPLDQQLFEWRLRAAVTARDWESLAAWTRSIPAGDVDVNRLQWLYWHARAIEAMNRVPAAQLIYKDLAVERDYYGFLAADRLGLDYIMTHIPVQPTSKSLQAVRERPAMQRAHEWFLLGEGRRARREWYRALHDMEPEELEISAYLTTSWGWHDRAIFALGRAESYDDLDLRFPVLYENELRNEAERYGLDLGWVFAKVRTESAFAVDARSPVGALGLMQLMPAVGRSTARKLGLRGYTPDKLLDAGTNIRLGSVYLAQLHQMYNGNIVLATGAYNAGPQRINTWLRRHDCTELDTWIELVPFRETRLHIKRVLFYAAVYDWRLGEIPKRISERMYSSDDSPSLCGAWRHARTTLGADKDS